MKNKVGFKFLATLGLTGIWSLSAAQVPAVNVLQAQLMSPSSADSYFQSAPVFATPLAGLPKRKVLQELARTLGAGRLTQDDYAARIYEYIYNNVETEFRYGLSKGAIGAILDQSATPFDQAHLMVELLREGGFTASYEAGTVIVSGTQFNAWTGITNAIAACRLLADGGIPAVVNGSTKAACDYGTSATVSSITLGHIWVLSNSKRYDPSFKNLSITAPMANLTTVMQCASGACATDVRNAMLSGAAFGTDAAAQADYVQNANTTALSAKVNTYAQNIVNNIRANNPMAGGADIFGARKILPPTSLTPAVFFPYTGTVSVQRTWTASIPDTYRTQYRLQFDQVDRWLFVDELSGMLVVLDINYSAPSSTVDRYTSFTIRAPEAAALGGWSYKVDSYRPGMDEHNDIATLQINHPYAAAAPGGSSGSYADATYVHDLVMTLPCRRDDLTIIPGCFQTATGFSPIIAMGDSGRGTATSIPTSWYESGARLWRGQSTQAKKLIDLLNGTVSTQHHAVGAFSAPGLLDVRSKRSVTSSTNNAANRSASIRSGLVVDNALEGGALQQLKNVWGTSSSVSDFAIANSKGHRFYDVSSTNINAVLTQTSGYSASDVAFIKSYFENPTVAFLGILPNSGQLGSFPTYNGFTITPIFEPFYAYTTDDSQVAYITTGGNKGAGSGSKTPEAEVNAAIERAKARTPLRSQYSVDLASGTLKFQPAPDIVTGSGDFPNSLSFQRSFNSDDAGNVGLSQDWQQNRPAGMEVLALVLPKTWTHNFQVEIALDNDAFASLGDGPAINSAKTLAALYVLRDLALASDFQSRLTSIFVADWMSDQFLANTAVLTRGHNKSTFVRLPDNSFNPPVGTSEKLVQTGDRVPTIDSSGAMGFDHRYVSFAFTGSDGSTIDFSIGSALNVTFVSPLGPGAIVGQYAPNWFIPGTWRFPTGATVTFGYEETNSAGGIGHHLSYVRNHLGRELRFTFGFSDTGVGTPTFGHIVNVTDENGRQAVIQAYNEAEIIESDANGVYQRTVYPGSGATFKDTGNNVSRYAMRSEWLPTAGYSNFRANLFEAGDLITPAVQVDFDSRNRVKSVTDKSGNSTFYFPGRVATTEAFSRGESVNAVGAYSTQYFDRLSHVVQSIDPLNRASSSTYYGNGLLKAKFAPEGNSIEYTYDARGNQLTETSKPKPGSAWPAVTSTNAYVEGPSVWSCAIPATCNNIASTTDFKGRRSDFSYNTAGQVTKVLGPTISSTRAESDYCYTALGGVSLLTGKVDVVGGGKSNRVSKFAYNSANKYVLDNARADPPDSLATDCMATTKVDGQNLTTTFSFDAIGDARSVDGPRTDVSDVTDYYTDDTRHITRVDSPEVILSFASLGYSAASVVSAYESYQYTIADRLISLDPNEGPNAGFVAFGVRFKLFNTGGAGRVPLYRCYAPAPRGNHYISLDAACETGQPAEANYGYVYSSQSNGTVPLHRFARWPDGESFATTDYNEGANNGYTYEGTLGYVLPATTSSSGVPVRPATRFTYGLDGSLRTMRRSLVATPTDSNRRNPRPTDLVVSEWQTETRDYYPNGDLKSVMDAENNLTQYAYNAVGRPTLVTDPDGRRSGTVYDVAGQTLCNWKGWNSAAPPSSCAWNPANYAAAGNNGPYRYVAYDYSLNGKAIRITDANNNITDSVYDKFDRLRYTLFPAPTGTTAGQRCAAPTGETVTSLTCPTGATYEELRYTTSGSPTGTTCSGNDQVCVKRTRRNQTITYTYDTMNRVATRAATSLPTVTFAYNLLSEPLSLISPAQSSPAIPAHGVAYDYNDVGRKLFEENTINGTARRVSYDYDAAGNRKSTVWPDTYQVSYEYDALNRMSKVWEGQPNSSIKLAEYTYDTLSRRQSLQYAGQTSNRVTYTYELDSNLDVLTNYLNATNVTLNYDHNRSGQITAIDASDAFYLPTPAASTDTYVPDNLNRYATLQRGATGTSRAFTYDTSGNLLTWFQRVDTSEIKQTYTYDAENRLRTAAVDGTATASITYDYDALGRRLSKVVSGAGTYYLLDGDEEIAEYNAAGVVLRRYITGPAVDDRIARVEGSGLNNPTKYYYHANHQGSVIDMTDSSGTITQQLAYDTYGNLTSALPAVGTGEVFRYTGRRYDDETKLYYYRARYYAPQIGRFLQTDPIGYKDDFNSYAYVGNNPINKADPKGLCKSEKGQVTDCNVSMNSNGLQGRELKAFNKSAASFMKNVAKVGEKIQKDGTDSQKAAWASVKGIKIDSNSGGSGKVGQEKTGEYDGKTDSITFYKGAIQPNGGNGPGAADYQNRVTGMHEIVHAEKWNKDVYQAAKESDADDVLYDHIDRVIEGHTEIEAEGAVKSWGLVPANAVMHSPYIEYLDNINK